MNQVSEFILNYASMIATFLIVLTGSIAAISLLLAIPYAILQYTFKRMKSSYLFVHFIRHRQAFKQWYKEEKNDGKKDVVRPKIKLDE